MLKSTLDAAINAGKSEQDAKDAASAAGRARTAELRQKFQDGLISHRGNDAEDVAWVAGSISLSRKPSYKGP